MPSVYFLLTENSSSVCDVVYLKLAQETRKLYVFYVL